MRRKAAALMALLAAAATIFPACENKDVPAQSSSIISSVNDKLESGVNTMEPAKEVDSVQAAPYATPDGFASLKHGVDYGDLVSIEYDSGTTGTKRKATVILPSGYDQNKEYPILYLLHGIGGDHSEWMHGKPQYIIGNLIASGEAKEMIVVLPNVRARENDSVPSQQDMFTIEHYQSFDNFINDLHNDLMPYMETNYPIAKGRENTAVAGLSMGGREALYIGFSKPETFGYIGAFTPAPGVFRYTNFGVTEEGLFKEQDFSIPSDYKTFIMIVKGKSDHLVKDEPLRYHTALTENGVEHVYYETDGGHDFTVWMNSLYHFAKRIFQ